jgi:hypothetical protein
MPDGDAGKRGRDMEENLNLTELYQIDGKSLVAPDQDVEMSFEDLDGPQSGRDESGFMHRILVRSKVGVWNFRYSHLTGAQYRYLLSVLPETESFVFCYPDPMEPGLQKTTTAYLSKYAAVWHNARTDTYRNMQFSVIEC